MDKLKAILSRYNYVFLERVNGLEVILFNNISNVEYDKLYKKLLSTGQPITDIIRAF